MDIGKIEQIMKLAKQYGLHKISIESDDFKLEIQDYKDVIRDCNNIETMHKENEDNRLQICNENQEYVIRAPLVGSINILKNKLTGKKFNVGDSIEYGQTICTIEAMKMINEITSNQHGIIEEILVDDNQFVEYDQPLFKLVQAR